MRKSECGMRNEEAYGIGREAHGVRVQGIGRRAQGKELTCWKARMLGGWYALEAPGSG